MVSDSYFDVCGVRIDGVSSRETLERIERFIADGKPHRIVTVNLDYLRHARSTPGFREALAAADLAVVDGVPLVWLSRLFRRPLPERIAGVDLAEECARLAAEKGLRLFLLGAGPGVAQAAARSLRERYRGLEAQCYTPPVGDFSPEEEERIQGAILTARPDILLVALSTPRQELWNCTNAQRWNVPVVIGVGAAFDMLSGGVGRAPMWMRRCSLEWAFRLALEPRRLWKRYLVHDSVVVLRILVSRVSPS